MKALASDFDGTLYFEDGVKEDDRKAILAFQKHHLFGLCTGRPLIGVQHYLENCIQPDFYIVSSGACILDKEGHVLYEQTLSKAITKTIFEQYHEKAEVSIQADFRIYTLVQNSQIPLAQTYVESIDCIGDDHIFGLSINAVNEKQAKQWTYDLNATYKEIMAFQNKEYIDIVKRGCSKGEAIKKLKSLLHLDYIYGIGDSYNDIPMLESADCSFTFYDSPEIVQKEATHLVSSICEAIERIERNNMFCQLKSLYLCVEDMQRAVAFYESFLQQDVTVYDDIYSVFDIHGFRLGLFAYQKVNEKHSFGSNCLPSFEFESLETLNKQMKGKLVHFPMTQIKENWVVTQRSTVGNIIECTTPVK